MVNVSSLTHDLIPSPYRFHVKVKATHVLEMHLNPSSYVLMQGVLHLYAVAEVSAWLGSSRVRKMTSMISELERIDLKSIERP